MGSDNEQINSLLRYVKSLETKTMGKDFEKYRSNAKLLDQCRLKKFPNLEKLGMIKKPTPDEE